MEKFNKARKVIGVIAAIVAAIAAIWLLLLMLGVPVNIQLTENMTLVELIRFVAEITVGALLVAAVAFL